MLKRVKELPCIFDLLFGCKTEEQVMREIEWLERQAERLNDIKDYWRRYQNGETM